MEAPKPKTDLLIERSLGNTYFVDIWAETKEAACWVEEQAPQYGRLTARTWERPWAWYLIIRPTYNVPEVLEYLRNGMRRCI
jgi:hypothetical protein